MHHGRDYIHQDKVRNWDSRITERSSRPTVRSALSEGWGTVWESVLELVLVRGMVLVLELVLLLVLELRLKLVLVLE